jgi:hypothetical protein
VRRGRGGEEGEGEGRKGREKREGDEDTQQGTFLEPPPSSTDEYATGCLIPIKPRKTFHTHQLCLYYRVTSTPILSNTNETREMTTSKKSSQNNIVTVLLNEVTL